MTSTSLSGTARAELRARALHFRSLHSGAAPLVLPNAWDLASARVVADSGAAAVATTSAGLAWGLGVGDGHRLSRREALEVTAHIAAAVEVPVTADVEGGYAADPAGVAATVEAVLEAGAVGVNLEDGLPGPAPRLRPAAEQAERVAAARAAADRAEVPLFVNARVDTYLFSVGEAAGRLEETLARAASCVAAGADGVFVPGVTDPETMRALAAGIDAPLNVMAGPGAPPVQELAVLGAARISVGPGIAQAVHGLVRAATLELLNEGTYTSLSGGYDFAAIDTLLGATPGNSIER